MKNKHIFIPLFVFIGAGLVSLVWSIIDFKGVNKQLSYSSETIQFNYDGASDGLDPNGRRFDAISFMTDDVIEEAFQKSGLTGETYSIENVKQYITIENVVPKNIVKEIDSYESVLNSSSDTDKVTAKDYHPVRYRFVVYQNIGVSQNELKDLVRNLVDGYVAKFNLTFTNSLDEELFETIMDFDSYDYQYQTKILTKKIDTIMNFGNELHDRHNDFYFEGKSFKDINATGVQLSENLSAIDEIINLRSITKDPERLRDYYNYRLEHLKKSKEKYDKDLINVTNLLNNYHKDETTYVGNGETIVEIGNNSEETYDSLLERKLEVENAISSLEVEIAYVESLRDKIDAVTQEDIENVERRINSVKTKYDQLENDFTILLTKYNEKYMGEGVITKDAITYQSSSLISMAFISRCIKIGAPIMFLVMLGIAGYFLIRVIRKERESA